MKKGFTIVEVSILFVIFLIVAFLAAPLSLDDTRQAKNTSHWRIVQEDFSNIFYAVNTQKENNEALFEKAFVETLNNDIKSDMQPYKILFLNGTFPNETYRFYNYKTTFSNAVISYKLFDDIQQNGLKGLLMYDVNGKNGPNVWGKDVFGLNIYEDRFEPFCKSDGLSKQKQDCSKNGTGLCCSNFYLIGGSFD